MKRLRFTIAGLLVMVVFVAVGIAALREATDLWDSGVFGVTLVLLLGSVLLSVHRTAERRAYWLGFALFGSVYLALSLVPPVAARLPTTKALAYLDSKVSDRVKSWVFSVIPAVSGPNNGQAVQTLAYVGGGSTVTTIEAETLQLWNATTGAAVTGVNGTSENFIRIGHSFLALILAIIGARLSQSLHVSGQSRRQEPSDVDRANATRRPEVDPAFNSD
jgi:hypothetical protein